MLQNEYRDVTEEYARRVKGFFGNRLVSICFFGSVTRGDATPESDIDALVIVEGLPRDVGMRVRETAPIHQALKRSEAYRKLRALRRSAFVSEVFLTPAEARSHPPILLDLTQDAVVVHDSGGFLEGVLEDMRVKLKQLGAKRVSAKKGYYWILKPDAKLNEVVEI